MTFFAERDRKSTRLNSSHTVIYTLSLHDALPIYIDRDDKCPAEGDSHELSDGGIPLKMKPPNDILRRARSEEHTSELQSHSDLHSFPTRRSSDLYRPRRQMPCRR